jgi:hypothetical protein
MLCACSIACGIRSYGGSQVVINLSSKIGRALLPIVG